MIFNDRRNAKALKAANGPSLAPKSHKTDAKGRSQLSNFASDYYNRGINVAGSRKERFNNAAIEMDKSGAANSNDPWTSKNYNVKRK